MNINPFESGLEQLTKAYNVLLEQSNPKEKKVLESLFAVLQTPQRILDVTIPVVKDSGETELFHGYRVQYNNILGPYKGGIRFHPNVDISEVKALSFWMAMKCAVANLPLGGGKGGIIVDPKSLSLQELERLSRAYVRSIVECIGPDIDVPAPDVNTNGVIMGWMVDEFIQIKNRSKLLKKQNKTFWKSTFTGKKLEDGGSEGREEATGLGGVYVLQAILKKTLLRQGSGGPESLTAAVQGFGNVGYNVAKFLVEMGVKVVAVSDSRGGIYVPDGINPELTLECKTKNGYLAGCYCSGSVCDLSKGKQISNEALLKLDVDILVPSALENVFTKENAGDIKAKFILEMANGPTSPEADDILFKKGVTIIPDILANSGGVTVSCFEWQQNLTGKHWKKDDVNKRLKKKMNEAAGEVWNASTTYSTDLRTAAFIVALERMMNK